MSVEYRDITGYPGYRVGSDGSVWTCKRQRGGRNKGYDLTDLWRPMKLNTHEFGYKMVCLSQNNKRKTFSVHILVCTAFNGPCPPRMVCRHLDGNPANNVIGNLTWGTYAENEADKKRHGTTAFGERQACAKLTDANVIEMRDKYKNGATAKALAKEYGVFIGAAHQAVMGQTWKHLPVPDYSARKRPTSHTNVGSRHGMAKLTEDLVKDIRRFRSLGNTQETTAAAFGVSRSAIARIDQGKGWKHVHALPTPRKCEISGRLACTWDVT